jgi:hypothetical protein
VKADSDPAVHWSSTERETVVQRKRLAPIKTWHTLESEAKAQDLRLLRTPGCVTVYDVVGREHVTITTEWPLSDEDADRVCRAALAAALDELRRIYP